MTINSGTILIKDQGTRNIKALVDQLPKEQREVVILRHYADMSFKEISLLTQVSITALGRMRYALINLRRMMGKSRNGILKNNSASSYLLIFSPHSRF